MGYVKQVIVVRTDLNMRKGKLASQVAHAAMKFILDNNESDRGDKLMVSLSPDEATWCLERFTKVVCQIDSQEGLEQLILRAKLEGIDVYPIIDAGKTEFHDVPTLTCASFGPCQADDIDKITGDLKLL